MPAIQPRLRPQLSFLLGLAIATVAATANAQSGYPATGYPSTAPPLLEPVETPPIPTSYADLLGPAEAIPAPADPTAQAQPVAPAVEAAPPVLTPAAPAATAGPAPAPAEVAPASAAEPAPAEPLIDPIASTRWYYPSYWFGPAPWDSGIEFGLNGASGTSESLSFRTGGFVKRKADDYKFDASLYYNKTQTEGVEIQSNALLDVRYDWLFDESPWTLFVMSQTFYDEFQAFDINFNANAGFGYQWFDTEQTSLTTSVGTGGSREFGGPDSEWIAEASFGVKYELNFADNKKFYAKMDYFPEWADFGNYRVLTDVGMEFELNQPSNMSLKLSATDRYDSQPQGVEPHNLNYSAMLIWKL